MIHSHLDPEPQWIRVESSDGAIMKLTLRGRVELLSARRIRRYLEKATGASLEHQELCFNDVIFQDEERGLDVGLNNGATLLLRPRTNNNRTLKPSGSQLSVMRVQRRGSGCSPDPCEPVEVWSTSTSLHGSASPGLSLPSSTRYPRFSPPASSVRSESVHVRPGDGVSYHSHQLLHAEEATSKTCRTGEEALAQQLELIRGERHRLRTENELWMAEQKQHTQQLEKQLREATAELELRARRIQQLEESMAEGVPSVHVNDYLPSCRATNTPDASFNHFLQESLRHMAAVLGIADAALVMDVHNTFSIPMMDCPSQLFLTVDVETQVAFLYTALLPELPTSPRRRLLVYEAALSGALLGKEMAGGGVGICQNNNVLLMHRVLDLRHAQTTALAAATLPFMAAAKRWIRDVQDCLHTPITTTSESLENASLTHGYDEDDDSVLVNESPLAT